MIRKILLVEDNESDIELTRRALHKSRIVNDLVVAEDGQEALNYLWAEGSYSGRDVTDQPALTLLDLRLPKLSGLDVLRLLRADPRTKRNPVVMLTSSKQDEDIATSYDFGANSYIRKPVDFEQFVRVVEQLGMYWLVVNEPPVRR